MPTGIARISHDDYAVVRDFIDSHGLWYEIGTAPPRLLPILQRFGWVVRPRDDMTPLGLYGVAFRDRRAKLLYLNAQAGCAAERAVVAHTLAHEVLGHELPIDEIHPTEQMHRRRVPVDERLESATRAATALILVPSAFIEEEGLSVEEIAAYCLSTENIVTRRLKRIAIGTPDSSVVRFDRRAPVRYWQRELAERQTGTDASG